MNWLKRLFGRGADTPTTPPGRQTDLVPPAGPPPNSTSSPGATLQVPDFPFPLVAVSGSTAEREWRRLQAQWRKEGASAVVIGDAKDATQLAEAMSFVPQTTDAILQAAESFSAEEYFARRSSECGEDGVMPDPGDWPDGEVPPIELGAHLEVLSRRPKRRSRTGSEEKPDGVRLYCLPKQVAARVEP